MCSGANKDGCEPNWELAKEAVEGALPAKQNNVYN